LSGSNLPLASIAREVGFSDQSHFSRTFKRATGMTPGAFRALFSDN
jgi:AraC-like DNA-binding protein